MRIVFDLICALLGRGRFAVCATATAAVGALLVLGSGPAHAAAGTLPDGRGYEVVSTLDGALGVGLEDPLGGYLTRAIAQVATDGNSLAFTTAGPPASASSGSLVSWEVSRRGADGWAATEQIPAHNYGFGDDFYPGVAAFAPDLSDAVLVDEMPLAPSTQANVAYVYGEKTLTNAFSLLSVTANPLAPGDPDVVIRGETPDLGTVAYSTEIGDNGVFDAQTADTPASPGEDVYLSAGGSVTLTGICPNGQPDPSGAASAGSNYDSNSVSANGEVAMVSEDCPPSSPLETTDRSFTNVPMLVARTGGRSIEVSAPQEPAADMDPNWGFSGPQYVSVNAAGSEVLFLSTSELMPDSNTGNTDSPAAPAGDTDAGRDLYQFNLNTGTLTDLTADDDPSDTGPSAVSPGADVLGGVVSSADGSAVYFVAKGDLAPGATDGQPNLYVETGGQITFIATLASSDSYTTYGDAPGQSNTLQTTADGQYLLFESAAPLAGYDNTDTATGQPDTELYRYSLATGELRCVSCDSDGSQPDGSSITIPAESQGGQLYMGENMSQDGTRVFFESTAQSLPQASNGVSNVYEWEMDGTGSCDSAADSGGCLYLLDPGDVADPAMLTGSSPNGNDVFIQTQQSLASPGADGVYNIYDARVGGGFPTAATAPQPCDSSASCQGVGAPTPSGAGVGTVSFTGPAPSNSRAKTKAVIGKVKVTQKTVDGSAFALVVKVPAKGRITVDGTKIRRTSRAAAKAGSYRLTVRLSKQAAKHWEQVVKSAARRRKSAKTRRARPRVVIARERITMKVSYKPAAGKTSRATVSIELKA